MKVAKPNDLVCELANTFENWSGYELFLALSNRLLLLLLKAIITGFFGRILADFPVSFDLHKRFGVALLKVLVAKEKAIPMSQPVVLREPVHIELPHKGLALSMTEVLWQHDFL